MPSSFHVKSSVKADELLPKLGQVAKYCGSLLGACATFTLLPQTGMGDRAPIKVPRGAARLFDPLGQYAASVFRENLVSRSAGESTGQVRRTVQTHYDKDYCFIAVPIEVDDTCIGVLALAFYANRLWDADDLQRVRMVGEMTSDILRDWQDTLDLQEQLRQTGEKVMRLQRLSEIDPLTTLENGPSFAEKVQDRLSDTSRPGAFILLDVDHFKSVNDIYGHAFGDTYLQVMARALTTSFPVNSIIGRIGGDEFAVFTDLPRSGLAYLNDLQSHVRNVALRAAAVLNKPDLGRFTMGVSLFPNQGTDYDTLFQRADVALYACKDKGRGGQVTWSDEVDKAYNHGELIRAFNSACDQGEVMPYFQPIVNLDTGRIVGHEVLCRWKSRTRGLMAPSKFARVLADDTMSRTLTRRMIRGTLEAGQEARKNGHATMTFAINLSVFDLRDRELVFDLQANLQEFGVAWTDLVFEVTESTFMGEETGQVFRSLEELRARGAKVALDDFGTGYGGLQHLKSWPVDILKVDRSFIVDICDQPRDQAILRALIDMARDMDIGLIVEGVEKREQAEQIWAMGVTLAQGFHFSAAISPQDFVSGSCARSWEPMQQTGKSGLFAV